MATRHRKPRTSRIDAAIDAMAPLGFTEEVVVPKMRQLLKEYAGQYGFIELDSYSVLLEALLADQEKEHKGQNRQQITHGETSEAASKVVEGEKVEEGDAAVMPAVEPVGFIDIPICSSSPPTIPPLPQPQALVDIPPPPPLPPSPPPPPPPVTDAVLPLPENAGPRRRRPCHGWISDDDEEWHFVRLPSSLNQPNLLREASPTEPGLTGARKSRTRRRSRWDLKPDDM